MEMKVSLPISSNEAVINAKKSDNLHCKNVLATLEWKINACELETRALNINFNTGERRNENDWEVFIAEW